MTPDIPDHWLYPASLQEAAEVQKHLASQVIREDQVVNGASDWRYRCQQ